MAASGAAIATFPPGTPLWVLSGTFVLAALGCLGALLQPSAAAAGLLLLGPVLPGLPRLLGGAGAPVLLGVAPAVLGGILSRRDGSEPGLPRAVARWGGLFLAAAAVSAASSAVQGESLFFLQRGRAVPLFLNALGMTADERTREALRAVVTYGLLLAALAAFVRVSREAAGRLRILDAAAASLLLSSVLSLLSRPLGLEHRTGYWINVERISGSATDPNALGLLLALLLPLAAARLAAPGALRWLAAAAVPLGLLALERSGSRSGFLLLAATALAWAASRWGRSPRARAIAVGAAALLAVALFAAARRTPSHASSASGGIVQRLATALRAPSWDDALSSRPRFWRAAAELVADRPLAGCGLGGFVFEFPAREAAAGRGVEFTDNATNALLDVAAETGLPGLALALGAALPLLVSAGAAFAGAEVALPGARAAGAAIAGLAVASLLGNHVRFPEVALLAAVAAALLPLAASPPAAERPAAPALALLLAGVSAAASAAAVLPSRSAGPAFRGETWAGVWREEPGDSSPPTRWSGPRAFRRIAPGETEVTATLRNVRPDGRPVTVLVDVDGWSAGRVELRPGVPARLRVGPLGAGAEAVRFRFAPAFVPALLVGGGDHRELGVRVEAGSPRP